MPLPPRIPALYLPAMHIPLISIATLASEIVITGIVAVVIWRGFTRGVFLSWLAFGGLAYELLVNVSYMARREVKGASAQGDLNPYLTGLAIFHGIFSLLMFLALIALFIVAWRRYRAGENYFAAHPRLTLAFSIAWAISILSGITLFADLYLM